MFTLLKERRRRRSSFSQAMEDDSTWNLQTRMAAKSKNKGLTPDELVAQAKERYEQLVEEEVEFDPNVDSGEPEVDPHGDLGRL